MKKYKGYYIDHVVFNSKADIDTFIKEETIAKYKKLAKMFSQKPSMELVTYMQPYMAKLHDECGLSYDEIEALEIEAIA